MRIFAFGGHNETRMGTEEADQIFGGNGQHTFFGLGGSDLLSGGNDKDTLHGGIGQDTLIGGSGQDDLYGGAGADVFSFENHFHSPDQNGKRDVIGDFDPSQDRLDVSGVSSGAITSMDQVTQELTNKGSIIHFDLGGLESNDMGVVLLGVTELLAADNFVFA